MNIAIYTLRAVSEAIITPPYVFMLIMIAVLFFIKNKKTVLMQKMIVGEEKNSAFELTISQVVLGIFAGTAASLILSYLGVVFNDDIMLLLLFMISIILAFFGGRFICFSYSAGILSLISVFLQFAGTYFNLKIPQLDFLKVDVVMLMSMVAVLHIIEGILIITDGTKGSIPVFTNRDNKIIGGFAFKRYWPIPIVLLFMMNAQNITASTSQVATPGWWPLIKSGMYSLMKDSVIGLSAFYGVLGYSSVTFTKTKKQKVMCSGISVTAYGIVLLLVAQLGRINVLAQLLVGIFAPAAHEAMLKLQLYFEMKGKPKYISTDEGLMVLEVAPDSPAYEMGIKTGDTLVSVNDKKIINEQDIIDALSEVSNFIWLKIKNMKGKLRELDYNKMNKSKRLGIVFVPKGIPSDRVVVKVENESFQDILNKVKHKKDK